MEATTILKHLIQLSKTLRLTIFLLSFLFLFQLQGRAQLVVSTSQTPQQLVQDVLVGTGVTVSNITFSGGSLARGKFTGGASTNLGLAEGVILSSGSASDAVGPNDMSSTTSSNGTGSDVDLASLVTGFTINDATVLQFDFVPTSDTIKFRYVFGSEEYPEFVGGSFNDVFGFFITGPNPAGGSYTSKNIAYLPGTTTPISINNLNDYTNAQYYIDNTSGVTIEYDGFTTVMTAWAIVSPCMTYHIKLAVGDAGDSSYDSAVFLEANSFSSSSVAVSTNYSQPTVANNAVEGCNDAIVNFTLPQALTVDKTVYFGIQGTATNGIDYTTIADNITIPAGQTTAQIVVSPYMDGVTEGNETVMLVVQTSICGFDTIVFNIQDNTPVVLISTNDTAICGGSANIGVTATGGIPPYTYSWTNGAGTASHTSVSPLVSTTYTVSVTDACGAIKTEQVAVDISHGFAQTSNDTTICPGGTATLTAYGGNTYLWSNGETTQSINVTPTNFTYYLVTVYGACPGYDSVSVGLHTLPNIDATITPNVICVGQDAQLNATGAVNYLWTDNPTGSSIAGQEILQNPIANPLVSTTYLVVGTDANTCQSSDTVSILVNPIPSSSFTISPSDICIGQDVTIQFNGTISLNATYQWDFNDASILTSGPNAFGPYTITWDSLGAYTVTLSVTKDGCTSTITKNTVNVNPIPIALFSAQNIEGCTPLLTIFSDSSMYTNPTTNYLWNFGDGMVSTDQNPRHSYQNDGIYDVSLKVTNNGSCTNTLTRTALVTVYPIPSVEISTDEEYVSEFDPVIHFAGRFYNTVSSFEWNLGDGTSSNLPSFYHTYPDTGYYYTSLIAMNDFGCVDTAYQRVYVSPDYTIYTPKAFTPDGDLLNDTWEVKGVNILDYKLQILNRWGQVVFESVDMDSPWDGKKNGTPCEVGVYCYIINIIDGKHRKQLLVGSLTLVK